MFLAASEPKCVNAHGMTAPRPDDGAGGTCLHWEDHRLLTIMEVRRAQELPDYEVLIGSPLEQWKILGNSVARSKALALGVSLRTAWLANTAKQKTLPVRVKVPFKDSVSGIDSDHKNEKTTSAVSGVADPGEAIRNGWSAKYVLNKLTAALTTPKALASAISDTIGESLTNKDHRFTTTPESQPPNKIDSVRTFQTGYETSRLKPYRFEDDNINRFR